MPLGVFKNSSYISNECAADASLSLNLALYACNAASCDGASGYISLAFALRKDSKALRADPASGLRKMLFCISSNACTGVIVELSMTLLTISYAGEYVAEDCFAVAGSVAVVTLDPSGRMAYSLGFVGCIEAGSPGMGGNPCISLCAIMSPTLSATPWSLAPYVG